MAKGCHGLLSTCVLAMTVNLLRSFFCLLMRWSFCFENDTCHLMSFYCVDAFSRSEVSRYSNVSAAVVYLSPDSFQCLESFSLLEETLIILCCCTEFTVALWFCMYLNIPTPPSKMFLCISVQRYTTFWDPVEVQVLNATCCPVEIETVFANPLACHSS